MLSYARAAARDQGLPTPYEHILLTHKSKTWVHYQVASTALQTVEFFHLVFLRGLVARGEDKSLVALKGGCNLRFFFSSIRYSEDIDLDVVVMSKATLKNKVDRLLASPLVRAPLLSRGIRVVDVSTPKQTDTTQRWKIGLEVAGASAPVRTKVEFSRRDEIEGAAFEAVSPEVLAPYSLTPMLATHYRVQRAIDSGKLDHKAVIDAAALVAAGVIRRAKDGIRLIAGGEFKADKVTFLVNHATAGAVAAIEAKGGKIDLIAAEAKADA